MSEDSTQLLDDGNTNDSVFENPMDDAIDSLLENAVETGVLAPAFDEQDEMEQASIQEADENPEELEDDKDPVDEDAETVETEENEPSEDEAEEEGDESLPEDEAEEFEEGELDMEFMVPVKIDGEESEISMEELIKGYQTNQSQTKKGQELAEQAKQLDSLKEDSAIYQKINESLLKQQDDRDLALLQSRKDIMDQVAKGGYVEGVDSDLATLQYQFDGLKEEYSKRKADRDEVTNKMKEASQKEFQDAQQERVEHFQKEIKQYVPDWSEEIAEANYKFALEAGIPEAIVATIADPAIAKFIDEFRRLKTSTSKGAVKRLKNPVKKVPTKKPVPGNEKKKNKVDSARKKLNKGKGSAQDEQVLNDDYYDNIFGGSKLF